ncbi:16S rRNA (guanine527-N7)-methyltransferase [Arenibacter algicola]|jgi:16S rRNA (guanine527-N7)-methyltransferase|uniref:Ribosomal RNA small subunit methyltransferase G n=1 Tax=Arenibacter algicola TaxID=616991 RepID=A0A221UX93_9FLAO|nr:MULTISPECIES: 16S rRNA (guanine(527)-N(7))-methyltransferase RsmG [Arenibacter]ASO05987.1 ribosomal RNA small subunit methyltransferase G [Arenibacter algicola]MDX1758034.1 16S rRNA (guanine(527)-N(7))-methyltransferase RsmG [Arenibacter algicola]GBF20896.1 ribosomal RNA small subunit methyltransferase G [Arenibacter sp. NBRC 103722]HCO82208.1 16S rRNA (guanine(527)-N(7))-methyltransferase RsmG [Arenibacter sp.]|tara:strand:- start:22076 stop:22711 length:636 start_codon:yes stop_codon:yes gene_type:complete
MDYTIIYKYFPDLTDLQKQQIEKLQHLYQDWNVKINVVSRKDIDELYLRHVLHSLAIAKFQKFNPGAEVLDVGTGGGFPGIPLAILYPETHFTLVDAIGKKIKVVQEVVAGLEIENVTAVNSRVEEIKGQFDFIVSRAVAAMPTFTHWVKGKIKKKSEHERKNGILYLKGGDLEEELKEYRTVEVYDLSAIFEEEFFETKKLVYLPVKFKG